MTAYPLREITLVTGVKHKIVVYRLWFRILWLSLREYGSIKKAKKALTELKLLKKQFVGNNKLTKMVKLGNRYYWDMHIPGYPSEIFDNHFRGAINRIIPVKSSHNRLVVLFFGITKSCPLRCQHCYNWFELNQDEKLTLPDLKNIVSTFQEKGVSQVHFLGGEPMARFDDLLSLVRMVNGKSEVWFSTSGYRLDPERALALRDMGLTGVAISVDHFNAANHNAFRGHKDAYDWGMNATENCYKAGLLICWSICVTNDFISFDNLLTYTKLAAAHHVNFIQIFEPMAVGRFNDKDVKIDEPGLKVLEEYFIRLNTDPAYKHLPIVIYTGYHQRRVGCLGAGNRFLYVDGNGDLHPCPFCRSSKNLEVLSHPYESLIKSVSEEQCKYEYAAIIQQLSILDYGKS